jgi:hypothetical protein
VCEADALRGDQEGGNQIGALDPGIRAAGGTRRPLVLGYGIVKAAPWSRSKDCVRWEPILTFAEVEHRRKCRMIETSHSTEIAQEGEARLGVADPLWSHFLEADISVEPAIGRRPNARERSFLDELVEFISFGAKGSRVLRLGVARSGFGDAMSRRIGRCGRRHAPRIEPSRRGIGLDLVASSHWKRR